MKTKLFPLLLVAFTANAADLSTTFSSTYSKVTVNNTITYTGSVLNKGVDTASNVQLLFYMPPKNVSIGNLPSGCSNANTKIICSIGELNVGDSASRTVSVFYTQKGANLVSVNAITDSNDTNYNNNITRLTTNVTASTNTENAPLIPNLASVKVSPSSIVQGNALTFTANLDAPLPNGYSVKVNYDGSNYTMNGSGTNYSLSNTPTTTGLKTFRTGIYDGYGNLKGSEMTGTFEVTKLNTAPTLSIISGADTATAGTAYALQLQANDVDGNLRNIQITNWGDGANESQTASNGANVNFSHTFNSAGSYTIFATAYDDANASSAAISKNVTVSNVVVTQPVTSTTGYSKIANNGSVLPDSAQLGTNPTDWACTKDNNTGLIWEIKTNISGLHSLYNTYTNYTADYPQCDSTVTGGSCTNTMISKFGDSTNTDGFVKAVNNQGLCGKNDWRLPTKDELSSLVYCSDGKYSSGNGNYFICTSNSSASVKTSEPTINTIYFPDEENHSWSYTVDGVNVSGITHKGGNYWTSSASSFGDVYLAVVVDFSSSEIFNGHWKSNGNYVRLVRGSRQ